MALDLGLHRALEKLAEDNGKKRAEEEERNLGQFSLSRHPRKMDADAGQSSRPVSGAAFIGLTISEPQENPSIPSR